jgi:hypothetical protein
MVGSPTDTLNRPVTVRPAHQRSINCRSCNPSEPAVRSLDRSRFGGTPVTTGVLSGQCIDGLGD